MKLLTITRRKVITENSARRYATVWDNKESSGDVIIEEKTEKTRMRSS